MQKPGPRTPGAASGLCLGRAPGCAPALQPGGLSPPLSLRPSGCGRAFSPRPAEGASAPLQLPGASAGGRAAALYRVPCWEGSLRALVERLSQTRVQEHHRASASSPSVNRVNRV